jgi:hypothetical protein
MNKYILKKAQDNLEASYMDWAQNHFVKSYQSQFDTPEAKLQVETAQKNMEIIQQKIDYLKKYIKENK